MREGHEKSHRMQKPHTPTPAFVSVPRPEGVCGPGAVRDP